MQVTPDIFFRICKKEESQSCLIPNPAAHANKTEDWILKKSDWFRNHDTHELLLHYELLLKSYYDFGYVIIWLETLLKRYFGQVWNPHISSFCLWITESRTKRLYKLSVPFIKKKTEMFCLLSMEQLQEEKIQVLKKFLDLRKP